MSTVRAGNGLLYELLSGKMRYELPNTTPSFRACMHPVMYVGMPPITCQQTQGSKSRAEQTDSANLLHEEDHQS